MSGSGRVDTIAFNHDLSIDDVRRLALLIARFEPGFRANWWHGR